MSERKKKVLIQTDAVIAKTGFGKAAKFYIEYLYKTGKYDIVHVAMGTSNQNPAEFNRFPWKTIPSINLHQLDAIKKSNDPRNHEGIERMAGYGAFSVDDAVREEKPDVFIGCQDIWGVDFSVDKKWFPNITSALWVTLDSLPILPKAVELAPKVKNYWSWADFATKALHKLGYNQVKTVRGPIDTSIFYRLSDKKRSELRQKFSIDAKDFIIGFVFRNQLRKSVPNLLQGFKSFKRDNPSSKAKLLLHTSWSEGWDIPSFIKEYGLDNNDILTTYICRNCHNYKIAPFVGQDQNCPHCKAEKQMVTTHPTIGVNEAQLNEIYNLMDVYAHPFTSGGQEIPIQEAKLTELITLVTNYSCGEDSCQPEAASLPLDWDEYREPGTQFIKATTKPFSIAKQLNKVFQMSDSQKKELGKKGRQWVIDNFDVKNIGKNLEEFIDNAPFANYSFTNQEDAKDPAFNVPEIADNGTWILNLYHNILKMSQVDQNDDGYKHWMTQLANGMPRKNIEDFFRKTAWEHNQKFNLNQVSFESFLNKDDKGRVLFIQPESAGDILLVTSLFKSVKERYPDWALYIATKPEYKDIIVGNPYVDKWIEYNPMMDNHLWATGNSSHKGFFNICYHPYFGTQRILDYVNNGEDKIDLNLKK